MVSTPTAILGLELQGAQDNSGVWNVNANRFIQGFEDSIAGVVDVPTTGGTTALLAVSYLTTDEARKPIIRIANGQTLLSTATVTTARARVYPAVANASAAGAFDVRFGGDASNYVTIPRGCMAAVLVRADLSTVFAGPLMVIATGKISGSSLESGAFLLGANNLSDVASAATAFTNIKQAATESATGVAELATTAEAAAGTDTARTVTPAGAKALLDAYLPPAAVTLWYMAAAPTGWTKLTTQNDKALRVVSGSGGVAAGTTAFSSVFAARTIAQANLPSYTLPNTLGVAFNGTAYVIDSLSGAGGSGINNLARANNGTSLLPSVTGSVTSGGSGTAMDFAVQYLDVILASRNA